MFDKFRAWLATRLTAGLSYSKVKDMDDEHKFFIEQREYMRKIHREKIKALESELERVKRAREKADVEDELAELYDEGEPEDEPEPEDFLTQMAKDIIPQFLGKQQSTAASAGVLNTPSTPQAVVLTDEEIQAVISQFDKKQIKNFVKLPNDVQDKLIRARFPALSDSTIARARELIK